MVFVGVTPKENWQYHNDVVFFSCLYMYDLSLLYIIWKKFGSPYKPLLLVLKSVFRFHFRASKVPVLFPSKLPRMCIFGNFGGSTILSDFQSFEHQYHTSHWGSLLQNQCNSGPWNLILYYAIPYNTGQYHNFTEQCRLSDAIHLPLFITFTFSSSAQLVSPRFSSCWSALPNFNIFGQFLQNYIHSFDKYSLKLYFPVELS